MKSESEGPQHVVFAHSEPWRAAVSFSAALRRQRIPTVHHITTHASKLQRLRVSAESLCFSATVFDVDVTPAGVVSIGSPDLLLPGASDVQATERIAEYLSESGVTRHYPGLTRIGPDVDPRVTFDKGAATAWARRHGIATPEGFHPSTAEDLRGLFPVVVKHPIGYGGKWVRICHTEAEVTTAADDFGMALDDLVVEQFLPGVGINVGGVAHRGEVLTAAAYHPQPAPGSPTGSPVSLTLMSDPAAVAGPRVRSRDSSRCGRRARRVANASAQHSTGPVVVVSHGSAWGAGRSCPGRHETPPLLTLGSLRMPGSGRGLAAAPVTNRPWEPGRHRRRSTR